MRDAYGIGLYATTRRKVLKMFSKKSAELRPSEVKKTNKLVLLDTCLKFVRVVNAVLRCLGALSKMWDFFF